jgi:Concanavalin A-like lectin/glucanases superfamily
VLVTAPEWVDFPLLSQIYDIMLQYSLASSNWKTVVQNLSEWTVTCNGESCPANTSTTIAYNTEQNGSLITVSGVGTIRITDSPQFNNVTGAQVYGVHVVSGSYEEVYLPRLVDNTMYIVVHNDGTFSSRIESEGPAGIPILPDVNDGCVVLTGATSLSIATPSSGFAVAAGDFTVALWFNSTSPITLFGSTDATSGIFLEQTAGPNAKFSVRTSEGDIVVTSPNTLDTTEWHHLTGIRHSGNLLLYVDGQQVASTAIATSVSVTIQDVVLGKSG